MFFKTFSCNVFKMIFIDNPYYRRLKTTAIPSIIHIFSVHVPPTLYPCSVHVPSLFHPCSIYVPSTFDPRSIHLPSIFHPFSIHFQSIFHPFSIHFQHSSLQVRVQVHVHTFIGFPNKPSH